MQIPRWDGVVGLFLYFFEEILLQGDGTGHDFSLIDGAVGSLKFMPLDLPTVASRTVL